MISPKFVGIPVSLSTTSRMPSGGFFIKSLTSRATLEIVRGGKFSIELLLLPPPFVPLLYWRYNVALAAPVPDVAIVDRRVNINTKLGSEKINGRSPGRNLALVILFASFRFSKGDELAKLR